jgi:uncharacterized membrane protein YdjX (TVP38/TMEM64 family)
LLARGAAVSHVAALVERCARAIEALGPLGPAAYVLLYVLAPLCFVPASAVSVLAGALFGPVWGGVWGLAGAVSAAAVTFGAGRLVGRDFVERHARGRLSTIKTGIEQQGWRFVVLVRFVPILPFALANLALGATAIRFVAFVAATFAAMLPAAFVYAYAGAAGREAASGAESALRALGIAVALLLALAALPAAIRWTSRRREARGARGEESVP